MDSHADTPRMQFPSFVRGSAELGQISPPLQPSPSFGDGERNNNTGRYT